MRSFFFRDDDADTDLPRLRQLLDVFGDAHAPLNLAVIPGTLQPECVKLLTAQDEWLDVHQHGWVHANHETTGRKCEFGPSREANKQREDILAGQQVMNTAFGDRWTPVFTPPWNRCTTDTHAILRSAGFAAVSQDKELPDVPMRQIPAGIDIFTWKHGPQLKSLAQVLEEINSSSAEATGILLHHKVMDETAFALTAAVVANLRSRGAPLVTMRQLLRESCP